MEQEANLTNQPKPNRRKKIALISICIIAGIWSPPVTGASMPMTSFCAACSAMRAASVGLDVLMSQRTDPGRIPARAPL